jgi:hypothetical protein
MADIFCRLNDDLKLEVLSFFSEYTVEEKIIKHGFSGNEFYSIFNFEKELCYGINEDFGYQCVGYYVNPFNPLRYNYSIEIEESIEIGETGFDIITETFRDTISGPSGISNATSFIFYIEYLKKSYYHSDMWLLTSGEGVECGTIFVNDNNLIDIMEQLHFKDDVISETLEKYKKKAK